MRAIILGSGSKGNSTLLIGNNKKILIDVGFSYPKMLMNLKTYDVSPSDIDAILITHTHSDHIGGLASVVKKISSPVFIKEELYKDIKKIIPEDNIVVVEEKFTINDFDIEVINASHDVPAFGFIINDGKKKILYLTDTGYINRRYYPLIKDLDLYIIESNHDEKMLMEGPYPYILKQRVISDKGHLSNRYTGKCLNKSIGDKTKYIILAHLSENNNTPELAYEQIKDELKDNEYFDESKIIIAKQHEETEMVEI